MKRQLILLAMVLFCGAAIAQHGTKKGEKGKTAKLDSSATTSKVAPLNGGGQPATANVVQRRYVLVGTENDWQLIFKVIRTSNKLSASDAEDLIDRISTGIRPLPDALDSIANGSSLHPPAVQNPSDSTHSKK